METKICRKCKEEKKICMFGKNNRSKDNLSSICKICDTVKSKEYRGKNREKYLVSQKNTYEKNKENRLIKSKGYYIENRDIIINRNKLFYKNNIDKYKISKKEYKEKNREKLLEKQRTYSKNNRGKLSKYDKDRRNVDPLFRTIKNVRNRINQYLKNKNYEKNSKSFDLVGCSSQFLKEYLEQKFTEGMSWDLMGKHIHIDHIIPLSSSKDETEVKKLCHYSNLQPLWAKDNLIKSSKIE